METKNNNENQNTSVNELNKSDTNLFKEVKSEKEDLEEDETEIPILRREIRSRVTTPYDELNMLHDKNLNYKIIRFDLDFYSDSNKFSWKVYHTPKEVRKHIKKIYNHICNRKLIITKPIHPVILQIVKDEDIIKYLPTVTNFYSQLFTEPRVQNNKTLTKFFNIGGTSFLRQNEGEKPFEGYAEKKVDKHCCRKCFMVMCPCCELCCMRRYNKRWVVVNNDHLFYLNKPTLKEGKVVYFFDKDMKIENV